MPTAERGPVLAIGLDAAEPALVRALMERNEMPVLRSLVAQGVWGRVTSPAEIGSGAVWPTFWTGAGPETHGGYSSWCWQPESMGIGRLDTDRLVPFWRDLARSGARVVAFDVPFAPLSATEGCSEVSEWGAHDQLRGRPAVCPAALEDLVRDRGGRHPFAGEPAVAAARHGSRAAARLAAQCLAGVRQRGELAAALLAQEAPDLCLVVFTEIHRASHALWPPAGDPGGALTAVFREVDHQLGRLRAAAGAGATVLVFSLHGMRATRGVPTILHPLLAALGLAAVRSWRSGAGALPRAVAQAVKARAPAVVKRLVARHIGAAGLARIGRTALMPAYDWRETRVFPLPSDQHGWLRINLTGREARGAAQPQDYEGLCAALATRLRGLRTMAGAPVVRDVLLLADRDGAPPARLPDLVVHWTDEASASPLRLADPPVAARPAARGLTGQHAPDGFYVLRPATGRRLDPPGVLPAQDLHRLLCAAVQR